MEAVYQKDSAGNVFASVRIFTENSRCFLALSPRMTSAFSSLVCVLAQVNPLVGDIRGNVARVLEIYRAHRADVDLVVFPELVLTGYPPEDLLLRPSLEGRIESALQELCEATRAQRASLVVGYPRHHDARLYNCAGVISDGTLIAEYRKQCLPNYRVFDEKRYFAAGHSPCVINIKGIPLALSICEDIWHPEPLQQAKEAGARLMININASPFHVGKQSQRESMLAQRAQQGDMPIIYLNQVGGQDELVFDGGACVIDAAQNICFRAPHFVEQVATVVVTSCGNDRVSVEPATLAPQAGDEKMLYDALVLGLRDYVEKNHFRGVALGLSGGIDSALTLAIAVDALGAEKVEAVMMPFRYTAAMSVEDAQEQAHLLGVKYSCLSIESVYEAFVQSLQPEFVGLAPDKTEENIQARCRGVLLMALSNKKGQLVLTTGNKSEVAVGYCTLYGDMVGGFAVLKDVFKTRVYTLANYRNRLSMVIPQRVIDRPPSAELAPGQQDQDSLPPYEVLDAILARYIEQDESAESIIAGGYEAATVYRVIRLVDVNEYKRRQAAIGPRVTERGFGRDRRYPITSGWEAR